MQSRFIRLNKRATWRRSIAALKHDSHFCSACQFLVESEPMSSNSCSPCARSFPCQRISSFSAKHYQVDSMFVLQSGKVDVLKSWGRREYLLSTLKEGDCFGEMALMDHGPRSASVTRG